MRILLVCQCVLAGHLELGQELAKQQRFDEASAVLQGAWQQNPKDSRTGLVLGSVLRASMRTDDAIGMLQNVLAIAPNVKAGLQLSYALREKLEASGVEMQQELTQQIVDALEPLAISTKKQPAAPAASDVAALRLEYAVALQELGRLETSATWYKRLIRQAQMNREQSRVQASMTRAHLNLG